MNGFKRIRARFRASGHKPCWKCKQGFRFRTISKALKMYACRRCGFAQLPTAK